MVDFFQVWDFEMIDTADAVDDSGLFEMEPMNELRVGSMNVQLYSLEKIIDEVNDYVTWYAQVGNISPCLFILLLHLLQIDHTKKRRV